MTKIYQIANGRWQITIKYDCWNKFSHEFKTAILWKSFETKEQAEAFAAVSK